MKNIKGKMKFAGITYLSSFVLLIASYSKVAAQLNNIPPGQHLYVSIDDRAAGADRYVKSNSDKIGTVETIYGRDIYPNDPLRVNEQTLTAAIVKAFPDSSAPGIATMDWEGTAFDILAHRDPSDSQYQTVMSEFQKALQIAKSTRPNVKWGFFGIPFRRIVFKSDDDWVKNNDKIGSLLSAVDVFFPSLYSSYSHGHNVAEKGELQNEQSIFSKDTKRDIILAVKYQKPVLVYMWYRYEITDSAYRDKTIPATEFDTMVHDILNTNYFGHRVNGVILWSLDTYFYAHKNQVYLREAPDMKSFKAHYDSLIIGYSKSILKQLKH